MLRSGGEHFSIATAPGVRGVFVQGSSGVEGGPGGRLEGHGEVRERGQRGRGRLTDGRWEDESEDTGRE